LKSKTRFAGSAKGRIFDRTAGDRSIVNS